MSVSSQGLTFSFTGFTAGITSIAIEEAQAEIVDMTGTSDSPGVKRMIATGDILTPAKIRVDYMRQASTPSPLSIQGMSGTLTIAHENFSVSETVIVESASTEISLGGVLRGSMSFVVTEA